MRTRVRNPFTTVQTSGLLLPVDLLARIVDGDPSLPGLTPDAYHLNAGERLNEAAARAWNTCVGNWKAFREAARKLPASDQGTTLTRDKWLLPLFRELGYGWLQANKAASTSTAKPTRSATSGRDMSRCISCRSSMRSTGGRRGPPERPSGARTAWCRSS